MMKKELLVLLLAALLLFTAGCGNDDDFSGAAGGQPSERVSSASVEASSTANETESAPESLPASHQVESDSEPTPRPEAVAGDGGDYDLLASSPYYSGQEALLQDICNTSTRRPPEQFLWLNEDTVRSVWGIEGYVSAGCRDFVAYFDFDRPGEEGRQEWFHVFIALFPGVEIPEFDHDGPYEFTPAGDWTPVEDRPGFEMRKLSVTYLPPSQMSWWDEPTLAEASPTPQPTPMEMMPVRQIRWKTGGVWAMVHLPESGLDAFWENVDGLFMTVDADSVERPSYLGSGSAENVASVTGSVPEGE